MLVSYCCDDKINDLVTKVVAELLTTLNAWNVKQCFQLNYYKRVHLSIYSSSLHITFINSLKQTGAMNIHTRYYNILSGGFSVYILRNYD